MQLLTTLDGCLHGMMECWARSEALALSWNNGQKRITSVFGSRLLGSIFTVSPYRFTFFEEIQSV